MIELKENTTRREAAHQEAARAPEASDDHPQARQERVDGALGLALQHVPGQGQASPQDRSVVLYDYTYGEVARYNFTNGWVSKVTMGAAKAGANEVLMEEVSIVCEELTRVK